jgi:phosphoribosylaminoimidazole carboxylase PurE protein
MKVAVFIGSESDFEVISGGIEVLKEFEISFSLEVTSAHRTPERTIRLVREMEDQGVEIFITAAGMAAHLGGVVAAHTTRPVIGIPVGGQTLSGLDALLSTVQMPKGVPVACMGIGKSGAINASLLAVQILGLKDEKLAKKMQDFRKKQAALIEKSSENVKKKL